MEEPGKGRERTGEKTPGRLREGSVEEPGKGRERTGEKKPGRLREDRRGSNESG